MLVKRADSISGEIEEISRDQVGALVGRAGSLLWIELRNPSDADVNWLEETFQFHPLAIEDVREKRQRVKMDRYDAYDFLVLPLLKLAKKQHHITIQELFVFVGSNYLILVNYDGNGTVDRARERWEKAHLPKLSILFLLYLLLDELVDSYFPIVDDLGDRIDDIDRLVLEQPKTAVVTTIIKMRRSLLGVRKALSPLRDALNELLRTFNERPQDQRNEEAYFTDVFDHVLRLTDFVDTYRDMLSGSLDAYQSSISNRLNQNMQLLTVAATMLATAAAITGFFGANLQGLLINSDWSYGAYIQLGLLIVAFMIEYWLFHRKGWI